MAAWTKVGAEGVVRDLLKVICIRQRSHGIHGPIGCWYERKRESENDSGIWTEKERVKEYSFLGRRGRSQVLSFVHI